MTRQFTASEQAEWDAVIAAEVAAAPPLRPDQLTRLAALFDCEPPAGRGAR
ncbi:hypothetical protein [Mycobacterium pseudokansasii]|uniref:Uncharacterized protein n=1 Tax=Mycobacterium pseudokansasii TaxID=2341080 RepID=A0A498QV88_9MYCO|nr:hypothetical protein [Mycobacterium pseudokansasii]VAZ88928.1 hypothetical protein LAUMK35_00722 [Mycobacterium pseudokansasii]VAZ89424.1 hypothetical protein LAUMK21_00720 [Mycobacterium pseudokansasii]VBA49774.1 hypothetical protein LAUMK142_02177 [Mycobacterium pseudokansasii]